MKDTMCLKDKLWFWKHWKYKLNCILIHQTMLLYKSYEDHADPNQVVVYKDFWHKWHLDVYPQNNEFKVNFQLWLYNTP